VLGSSSVIWQRSSVSGRLADAERLAERSVLILEKTYTTNDVMLLLQILAASRFEQGKTARAREAFKRMQAIRIQHKRTALCFTGQQRHCWK
jgi:hypothetical protein